MAGTGKGEEFKIDYGCRSEKGVVSTWLKADKESDVT